MCLCLIHNCRFLVSVHDFVVHYQQTSTSTCLSLILSSCQLSCNFSHYSLSGSICLDASRYFVTVHNTELCLKVYFPSTKVFSYWGCLVIFVYLHRSPGGEFYLLRLALFESGEIKALR